jgi:hypothetical protein
VAAAARAGAGVGGANGTRFFERQYELKTGKGGDAASGLEDRMRVDQAAFYARLSDNSKGIEEEVAKFEAGSAEEAAELRDIADYVFNQKTSEKEYPNGIRDKGRNGVRPSHFTAHPSAQRAKLGEAEVFSLRLYTTLAYLHMNNPLRDDKRYARGEPVPLPAVSHWAANAIKKLRAVHAESEEQAAVVLWRGMRSMRVTEEFMLQGGTELAFMSTTTDLAVAVRYSLSRQSLIFKILVPSFMSRGADLAWLSAFPDEAEVLYPPLTYLKPTGRTDRVDAKDCDGNPVTFTVVEVTPYIG